MVGFDHVEFCLNPVILEIGKFKRILPFCVPENKTVYWGEKKKPFTVCLDKTHKAPCLPITRPGTNFYALLKLFPEQLVSLINQDKILVRKTGEVSLLPSEP